MKKEISKKNFLCIGACHRDNILLLKNTWLVFSDYYINDYIFYRLFSL